MSGDFLLLFYENLILSDAFFFISNSLPLT